MFPDGSIQPYERTRRVLAAIAPMLRRMPNRHLGHGPHRRARGPARGRLGSAWDLSGGRAITCARSSPRTRLPDDRFAAVAGKADVEPMFPDNPYLAANRRVTVTLLKEAPPMPFGTKP